MTSPKEKKLEESDLEPEDFEQPEDLEGWESLAEEAEGGTLAANPELEAALQEAAEAVEDGDTPQPVSPAGDDPATEEMERLRAEAQENRDRYIRLQADFDNFRRRALKERTDLIQYGHENLVKDLLSTVDNLDRAIDHARRSDGGDLESFLQGVELLQRDLKGVLEQHGVNEIDAVGSEFDPALHEAMAQRPDDSVAPNTVMEVLQKGYQIRNRLLRAVRVVVAKSPEDESEEKKEEGG
jgi:molecular chaperone GrpE